MGLNESFTQIRGNILVMEPFPSVEKVFSLVLQEEKQIEIGVASISDTSIVYVVQANKSKNVSKDRPICAHCCISGHTKDKCFKMHGYPPGYKKYKAPALVNHVAGSVSGPNSSDSPLEFTPQICHQLMAMLHS